MPKVDAIITTAAATNLYIIDHGELRETTALIIADDEVQRCLEQRHGLTPDTAAAWRVSSDRSIRDYCDRSWKVSPMPAQMWRLVIVSQTQSLR